MCCLPLRGPVVCTFRNLWRVITGQTNLQQTTELQAPSRTEVGAGLVIPGNVRALLCSRCWEGPFAYETFRRLVDLRGEDVTYSTTWPNVEKSAHDGCGFCSLLLADKETTRDEVTFRLWFRKNAPSPALTPPGTQYLHYEVVDYENDMVIDNNELYLRTAPDDPAAAEIVARDPVIRVDSPQCHTFAMNKLMECVEHHERCPKPPAECRLPTRLIDCIDPAHPRLFVSGAQPGRYVALSYVWGEEQPHRTVEANIGTYQTQGIDAMLIPRTIFEAIAVTRRLGLRYLWVDAFCIVQDSREDKIRELVQLRRIFRDAYVTIIAACAPTASAGFLHDRTPESPSSTPPNETPLPMPRLPYWCADGRLGVVTAEPAYIPYDELRDPANTRAWCLEERLLSPRKLVYASDTLQYHCQTSITYVGDALARPRRAERLPDLMFMPDAVVASLVSEWTPKDWRLFSYEWADVLNNYTRRAVTKPKDKLTAFAGVAEQFQRIWHPALSTNPDPGPDHADKQPLYYLAGLWRRTITRDLLWRRMDEAPLTPRPSRYYLAPSWSWASVDGPIGLYRAYDSAFSTDDPEVAKYVGSCNVLSCEVTLEDTRLPHGRIKGGLLQLKGRLIRVPTSWRSPLAPRSTAGLYLCQGETDGDLQMTEDFSSDLKLMLESLEGRALMRVGEVRFDTTDTIEGEVWVLPILWNRDEDNLKAAGLLVEKLSDKDSSPKFKRVGFWDTPETYGFDRSDTPRQEELAGVLSSWFKTFVRSQDEFSVIELI